MTRTVSNVMSQDVSTVGPAGEVMTAGERPVDGVSLRSAPAIESLWISTFNLRWWEHLQDERLTGSSRAEDASGRAKVRTAA
jgi:hypothetical protein